MALFKSARTIHTRFLISFLFLLLPMVVFGALWTGYHSEEERHIVLANTEGQAERMVDRLASLVRTVETTLKTISEVPAVREAKAEARPLLASLLPLNPSLNNIYLVDRNGRLVTAADPDPALPDSFADRAFFKEAMRSAQLAVGETVIASGGKAKGRPVVHIASPLRDGSGTPVGIIAASIALETLEENMVARMQGDGSFLYAVDGKGNVLIHPDRGFLRSIVNMTALPPVSAVLRGEQGVMEYRDQRYGQDYVAVFRPIPSTPWGIVAAYPLAQLQASRNTTSFAGAVVVALTAGLALLLATLVSRPIAVSIGQLAAAARTIGEGKVGTVVSIKRRDEIGTLARAFNAMSLDLADLIVRLEEAHRRLDRAFREVGAALTSGLDLHLTLEVAMHSAMEQLQVRGVAVGLIEDGGACLRWAAAAGDASGVAAGSTMDIAEHDFSLRQVILSMKPVVYDGDTLPGASAVLPLVSRGERLGVFVLFKSADRSPMSEAEANTALSFANQVAIAIANARAHAEIQRLVGELRLSNERLALQNEELAAQNEEIQVQSEEIQSQDEEIRASNAELQARNQELDRLQSETMSHLSRVVALSEVSRAISSSLDLGEVCQQAIESTIRVMGSRLGLLHTVNWDEGILELKAAVEAPEEYVNGYAVLPINDQSVSGRAVLTMRPQFSGEDVPPPITQQAMAVLNASTLVTLPIVCRGKVVGVLNVGGPYDRHATAEEVGLLVTIAGQIGVAIENASLYNRVRELDRLKDEFMSIASHELRTPLTSIKGYAQLLMRKAQRTGAPEADMHGLRIINEQIDRMTRLVNELLNVSRIAGGRLELQVKSTDLGHLLKRVVDNARVTTKKHKFFVELPRVEIIGNWDEGRLEEVLQNLLDNAVKYSPEGGSVWVKSVAAGEEVQVSVQDEGIGIPKSHLPHVFERFYQVRSVSRGNYGGLGLGLYISHQIVLRHGGRMWVESEDGRGTIFHFILPREGPPA